MPDQTQEFIDKSDLELIHAIEGESAAALTALAKRHGGKLIRYANALCREDGEDAVQETFLAVWRSCTEPGRHRFSGGSVRGWLFTITRNSCMRRFRKRAGEPKTFDSLEVLANNAGWNTDENPESLTERLRSRHLVQKALMQLSERDREVIYLRDIEGLSGPESAALIGIELPALKSRLHRARLQLVAAVKGRI